MVQELRTFRWVDVEVHDGAKSYAFLAVGGVSTSTKS